MYCRVCPRCRKRIDHSTKQYRDKALKKKSVCKPCSIKIRNSNPNDGFFKYMQEGVCAGKNNPFYGMKHTDETKAKLKLVDRGYTQTDEYKKKMSKTIGGVNNGMYGKTFYQCWVRKYGKVKADQLLVDIKKKRSKSAKGTSNPMYGKPSPQGAGNGWSGWYKGMYFRSLKELSYVVGLDDSNITWIQAEHIVIKYSDWEGTPRTYRPDILVRGHLLVEIKPEKLWKSINIVLKRKAAHDYCRRNGLTYRLIDPDRLPLSRIRQLRKDGLVKFLNRYEIKFQERYGD